MRGGSGGGKTSRKTGIIAGDQELRKKNWWKYMIVIKVLKDNSKMGLTKRLMSCTKVLGSCNVHGTRVDQGEKWHVAKDKRRQKRKKTPLPLLQGGR